ncbi:hypothetical protein MHYP_G00102980 [Metynnis hypsauchen]
MDASGKNSVDLKSEPSSLTTPPRKKQKRLQKYRVEWEKEHVWLERVHDNGYKANCTVCQRNIKNRKKKRTAGTGCSKPNQNADPNAQDSSSAQSQVL